MGVNPHIQLNSIKTLMSFFAPRIHGSFCLASLATTLSHLPAQDGSVDQLDGFSVIGSKEKAMELQGSGYFIDVGELEAFKATDITQVLRTVPGVYVRPEDGYGLFPNISLRGVDSGRSAKVTIMEDGILSAPSPFSDPAAYYSPTAGRMAGFEVLKGSSQVRHGPQTTGGVVNYLSTPIPATRRTEVTFSYGEEEEAILHLTTGGREKKANGTLGYLFEVYHHQTDGWKTINGTASMSGSGDTGFEKTDYMAKLGWTPGNDSRHYFEFKAGYTSLDGDVGYTGLSTSDFMADPYQRYAATRFDNIASDHTRLYLRHLFNVDESTRMTSTVFYNEFNRDWYKLADVTPAATWTRMGLNSSNIEDPGFLAVLKGTAVGQFRNKHNDRTYKVRGVQSKLEKDLGKNLIEGGLRYTHDVYDGNVWTYGQYSVDASGNITRNADTAPSPADSRKAKAWEFYVQDTIDFGALDVTPGVRYTTVDFLSTGGVGSDIQVISPGLGFDYDFEGGEKIFGGYFRGQALPGPNARATGVGEETSDSFELGFRKAIDSGVFFEITGFHTKFDNMVAQDSVGLDTVSRNFGEATSLGVEFLGGLDLGTFGGFTSATPLTLSATYTDSEFDTATSGSDFWGGALPGNAFPYVPQWQLNARLGLVFGETSLYMNYQWVDDVFTSADNSTLIGSYGLLDVSLARQFTASLEIFGKVTNVTDEEYASTRLPAGWRAGAPRLFSVGVNYLF
jgi:Fe(3+) dicitrate transport protein